MQVLLQFIILLLDINNGLLICFGQTQDFAFQYINVTLPTSFSNNTYIIVHGVYQYYGTTAYYSDMIRAKYASSFDINSEDHAMHKTGWVAIGY